MLDMGFEPQVRYPPICAPYTPPRAPQRRPPSVQRLPTRQRPAGVEPAHTPHPPAGAAPRCADSGEIPLQCATLLAQRTIEALALFVMASSPPRVLNVRSCDVCSRMCAIARTLSRAACQQDWLGGLGASARFLALLPPMRPPAPAPAPSPPGLPATSSFLRSRKVSPLGDAARVQFELPAGVARARAGKLQARSPARPCFRKCPEAHALRWRWWAAQIAALPGPFYSPDPPPRACRRGRAALGRGDWKRTLG